MAIAFVRPQIISRAGGRSAVACAAYRAGDTLEDKRQGKTQDYEHRAGVIASGILLPANAPEWMRDREALWNAVERREDRSTRPTSAQLARELVIALPHELDDQHREYLIKNIGKEATRQGLVFDYALHAPDPEGDERNYHAHIMLTMRRVDGQDPDGFGNKEREWNRKTFFHDFSNTVERETNRMLERCGIEERITFQVVEREAQKHMGLAATQLERQGVLTEVGYENRAIRERNREREEARRAIEAELKGVQSEITYEEAKQAKAERERQELEEHERKHAAAMAAAAAARERREQEQRERQAQREREQAAARAERERQELKQREQAQATAMAAAAAARERREQEQRERQAQRERQQMHRANEPANRGALGVVEKTADRAVDMLDGVLDFFVGNLGHVPRQPGVAEYPNNREARQQIGAERQRENATHARESTRDVRISRSQDDSAKTPEQERKERLLRMAMEEFRERELNREGGGGRTRGR